MNLGQFLSFMAVIGITNGLLISILLEIKRGR